MFVPVCSSLCVHFDLYHAKPVLKNSVDPDQVASEKPAYQDLHFFFALPVKTC